MIETIDHPAPGMNPPEGSKVGMPGEYGFYSKGAGEQSIIPSEAQRIYDTVADYHDTVQAINGGEDIDSFDAESDAWRAVSDIAFEVEKNPITTLTENQHNLFAAVEAHSAALKTSMPFSEQQNIILGSLNSSKKTGGVVHQMSRERWAKYQASNDQEEKDILRQEWQELKEYTKLIDNGEAGIPYYGTGDADILGVENVIKSYKDGGVDPDLINKARIETKANAYFAKYAIEIVSNANPELQKAENEVSTEKNQEPLTLSEQVAEAFNEETDRIYSDPYELRSAITDTRSIFFTDKLQKMRERYTKEPTSENKKHVEFFEKEFENFNVLLEIADEWEAERINKPDIDDFATYVSNELLNAETQLENALDNAPEGKLAGDSSKELTSRLDKISRAYNAGWGNESSINKQMKRRIIKEVRSRTQN